MLGGRERKPEEGKEEKGKGGDINLVHGRLKTLAALLTLSLTLSISLIDCDWVVKFSRSALDEGNVPKDWKSGNMTPIYQKCSRTSVDNYRPVSLMSVICTVMERLLRKP